MAMGSLSMKKLKEVLRLKLVSDLTNRQVARALGISAGTVSHYMTAWRAAELDWSITASWDDEQLIGSLLPHCKRRAPIRGFDVSQPDFIKIHQGLKKKGVNRQLVWEEYKTAALPGKYYSYTEFCRRYRQFLMTLKPSMRQTHSAGEKCFIDYCGPRIPIYNDKDEVEAKAYVFVATLGASNYTFVTATLTRSLPDWIAANVATLNYFGGVPALMIPDNEKSAVSDACYYDPDVNPTYADFARHYDTVILPTRPGCPKDKSKVEKAVQFVETWIIGKLRHHRFQSIDALNAAIKPLLEVLNDKPFQQLPGTRKSQFEALDKPALKPLPRDVYDYAIFQKATVHLDYHVTINKHYYSVPQHLIGKTIEVRVTQSTIECLFNGKSVARHQRDDAPGERTTNPKHMPKAHLAHQEWTPAQFQHFAEKIGPFMARVATQILAQQRNPECVYRIHNGFRQLAKVYGQVALEGACEYALVHQAIRYKHIKGILQSGLATLRDAGASNESIGQLPQQHQHVRGPKSYTATTPTGEPSC